jgi:aminoglycoside phosphotransferase (APT) family kinase protein
MAIVALVEHLAGLQAPYSTCTWDIWQIQPVPSGNNLLFRATSARHDVVVKFLIRDERQRAEREWGALTLLERLDLPLGPRPIYCDLARIPHAVVVQTWLDGQVLAAPPADDQTWLQIVQAYVRLHQVPRAAIEGHGIALPQARAAWWPAERASAALHEFAQQLPTSPHTPALDQLLRRLDRARLPALPPRQCWSHGDPNIRNLLRADQGVQLVDWEYTGYGDPAAEIALLMTHPFAQPTSDARWQWVAEQYAQLSDEPAMCQRIREQYALRLVWWCIRLLLGHYVLLRQPTRRLAGPGAEAEISTVENIERYFARAHTWLAQFP